MKEINEKEIAFQKVKAYVLEKNYQRAMQACSSEQLLEDDFYVEKLRQLPMEQTNFYVYALVRQLKNVKERDLESALARCDQDFLLSEPRVQLMKVKILVRLGRFDEALDLCHQFANFEGFFLQRLKCLFQKGQYDELLEISGDKRYQKDYCVEEYRIKAWMRKRCFVTASKEIKMSPVSCHTEIQELYKKLQSYLLLKEVYQNTEDKKKECFFHALENILAGEEPFLNADDSYLYYEKVLLSNAHCDFCGGVKSKALLEEAATLFSFSLEEKRRLKKKKTSVDFVFYFDLLVKVSQKYQEILGQIYSMILDGLCDEASSLILLYKLDQDSPFLLESVADCASYLKLFREKR